MLFKQQGSTFRSGTLASNGDAVNAATDHHDLEPLAIQGRAGFLRDVHTILDAIPRLRRSEEHTSELQSRGHLVCRLLLEKKKIFIHLYSKTNYIFNKLLN